MLSCKQAESRGVYCVREQRVCRDRREEMRKKGGKPAAAANLDWLGLNLRRMNREGLNHVTYYEAEREWGVREKGKEGGDEGWK